MAVGFIGNPGNGSGDVVHSSIYQLFMSMTGDGHAPSQKGYLRRQG